MLLYCFVSDAFGQYGFVLMLLYCLFQTPVGVAERRR